jgi:hypothetical protein
MIRITVTAAAFEALASMSLGWVRPGTTADQTH